MKKQINKKDLQYVQFWPLGVGVDNFKAFAFETQKGAEHYVEKWSDKEIDGRGFVSRSDYDEMQAAFGNNFAVSDGEVMSRREAVELNALTGREFY